MWGMGLWVRWHESWRRTPMLANARNMAGTDSWETERFYRVRSPNPLPRRPSVSPMCADMGGPVEGGLSS